MEHLDRALTEASSAPASYASVNEEVAALAAFTGIEFDSVTNLLLPVSSPLTRRYTFRGRVHGLFFGLRVDVKEDNLEILQVSPTLLPDLAVLLAPFLNAYVFPVRDAPCECELSPRLPRVGCATSVHCGCSSRASRTLHAPPRNERPRLLPSRHAMLLVVPETDFRVAQAKYGESVQLPFGSMSHRLLFDGARKAGFSFSVEWSLTLDFAGNVSHNVSLLPRYSAECTPRLVVTH